MQAQTILLLGVDGYIGNALAQRLLCRGHRVVGIDNLLRRRWIKKEMNSFSAIPIQTMRKKAENFDRLGSFEYHQFDITKDVSRLRDLIRHHEPETIVNLAHIPSGPYSQISMEHARFTLSNNILATNDLLWIIHDECPDVHYITVGTTGQYDHYSNIDIEEGYISITHKGRKSVEMLYPRRPGSTYHVSKTGSTILIDFLARTWGLRCTDVQQSVVYGTYTDEIDRTKIYSRLDCDEAGGTVVNRFIVQAVLGLPLTIYGAGRHQRGFISLNDSIQALEIAVGNPAPKGHVQVWNQLSEWHSINQIAKTVIDTFQRKGIDVKKARIESPRTEYTGQHYYKYITKKLKRLGYVPTRSLADEIEYTSSILLSNRGRISKLKNSSVPKIFWS